MQLQCRVCGAEIPAEDINLDRALAKCRACNSVFAFSVKAEDAAPALRAPVPLPSGLRVDDTGLNFRIVRRWFSAKFLFLVFFCIAWDSFLVFWYSIAFGSDKTPWVMIVFPVAHVAVGIGLTYFTLAGIVNRTFVEVMSGHLIVRHGPLPWRGNHAVPTMDLDQLYVTEHVSHSRNGGSSVAYQLNARLRTRRTIKLLSGLEEADQALFIEQQLERHLGIEDRPVGGELRR